MSNMWTKLFFLVCVAGLVVNGEQIAPVFMWGADSDPKPALETVSQSEFASLLKPYLKDHMIVSFEEENLTPTDFLCSNAQTAKSCYAHLRSVSKKSYYPHVENPKAALNSLTVRREYNSIDSVTGELSQPIECSPGQVHYVTFDNSNDDRNNDLEAHDVAIDGVTKQLSACPVVYIYTSAPSSSEPLRRHRRDASDCEEGCVFRDGNRFLIYYDNIAYTSGSNTPSNPEGGSTTKATPLVFSHISLVNVSDVEFNITLNGAKPMTFSIQKTSDGYFAMKNIVFDGQNFYTGTFWLNAPTTFSYHCSNLTLRSVAPASLAASAPVSYLQWNALQFQAPFDASYDPAFKFGDAWACVGFFTPGILAGLFVVTLLLFITFIGICWMVDINTMDRFDDPKGKTITVNINE